MCKNALFGPAPDHLAYFAGEGRFILRLPAFGCEYEISTYREDIMSFREKESPIFVGLKKEGAGCGDPDAVG